MELRLVLQTPANFSCHCTFVDASAVLFASSTFRDENSYLADEETAQTLDLITRVVEGSQADNLFLVRSTADTPVLW